MNNKEIFKVYPKWVWFGNIFCIGLGLCIILFV